LYGGIGQAHDGKSGHGIGVKINFDLDDFAV
jgi:hypothetical protein